MSTEYTSPWAGASVLTFAQTTDKRLIGKERHLDNSKSTYNSKTWVIIEIDSYSMKMFKRLADTEPEAHIMYSRGVQYFKDPAPPGEDPLWVRDIYYDVSDQCIITVLNKSKIPSKILNPLM